MLDRSLWISPQPQCWQLAGADVWQPFPDLAPHWSMACRASHVLSSSQPHPGVSQVPFQAAASLGFLPSSSMCVTPALSQPCVKASSPATGHPHAAVLVWAEAETGSNFQSSLLGLLLILAASRAVLEGLFEDSKLLDPSMTVAETQMCSFFYVEPESGMLNSNKTGRRIEFPTWSGPRAGRPSHF